MSTTQQQLLDAILEHERRHPIDPKNPPKVVRELLALIEQDVIKAIAAGMDANGDPSKFIHGDELTVEQWCTPRPPKDTP